MDAPAPISSPVPAQSAFVPPPPPPAAVTERKSHGTDVFIRDLNLVAEAAKRAQMAVLMRDLEGQQQHHRRHFAEWDISGSSSVFLPPDIAPFAAC
ncbi:hypothetical protein F4778DRAFT_778141 [Xylariomycetidae sp. FL2044]|nr:hypothetical protein F4778DRAFT_778141 [Xylariomycetidae sp. FL2044]